MKLKEEVKKREGLTCLLKS